MASPFSHAIAAFAIGKTFKQHGALKFLLLGMLCAVVPDVDLLTFRFGIPYGSLFGHRGFTHSIVFALLLALVMTSLFYHKEKRFTGPWLRWFAYLFLCTLSHGLLDALTNGGLGVAFFSPFSNERYFFPFRPVRVSPLDAGRFFTAKGWEILKSEMIWIWIPLPGFSPGSCHFKSDLQTLAEMIALLSPAEAEGLSLRLVGGSTTTFNRSRIILPLRNTRRWK